jgi:bifunctional DNA-binding transcriptional regulator/antitoxin component of YhaV-PrlF toxin-antitoxin module
MEFHARADPMELVKLGKKGQLTIPKSILKATGIPDEAPLLVEVASDGAIILRQAGVYPIELYSDQRIKEFEKLNTIPSALEAKVETFLKTKKKK